MYEAVTHALCVEHANTFPSWFGLATITVSETGQGLLGTREAVGKMERPPPESALITRTRALSAQAAVSRAAVPVGESSSLATASWLFSRQRRAEKGFRRAGCAI